MIQIFRIDALQTFLSRWSKIVIQRFTKDRDSSAADSTSHRSSGECALVSASVVGPFFFKYTFVCGFRRFYKRKKVKKKKNRTKLPTHKIDNRGVRILTHKYSRTL